MVHKSAEFVDTDDEQDEPHQQSPVAQPATSGSLPSTMPTPEFQFNAPQFSFNAAPQPEFSFNPYFNFNPPEFNFNNAPDFGIGPFLN